MILTVIGARPQFIKAAVVSEALKQYNIEEIIIHTGQHYDDEMSKVFWEELKIPPISVNLEVGSGSQSFQTAKIMESLDEYILNMKTKPNAVLVYGDTNSTIAAALVASKVNIPIIHIESGLRSFNRTMPEEINRIVTDHLSSLLFCSSKKGVDQLNKEGINENVFNSGDVMFDSVLKFGAIAEKKIKLSEITDSKTSAYSILTMHRPSNTDNQKNLENILSAVKAINQTIIWPLHPRLKSIIQGYQIPVNLKIISPLSYLNMMCLLQNCNKVFTDSGGLQKEAYWLKKPCITLRGETEWTETVESGWNEICGTDAEKIIKSFYKNVPNINQWVPLYGTGNSANFIAKKIYNYLN